MLARSQRLTRGAEYKAVVRRGRRCATAHLITYTAPAVDDSVRFGFIVSKQVGTAVVRNTVRRRLKSVCAQVSSSITPGTRIVIRALPSSAAAAQVDLHRDVSRCLTRTAS